MDLPHGNLNNGNLNRGNFNLVSFILNGLSNELNNQLNNENIPTNEPKRSSKDFIDSLEEILKNNENRGQSYSIFRGIKKSSYDIIVTSDGDGQNNPKDILKEVESNFNKIWNSFKLQKNGICIMANTFGQIDALYNVFKDVNISHIDIGSITEKNINNVKGVVEYYNDKENKCFIYFGKFIFL